MYRGVSGAVVGVVVGVAYLGVVEEGVVWPLPPPPPPPTNI